MSIKLKRCVACKDLKDHSEFNKDNRKVDGLCGRCRICSREQWHEEHKYQVISDPWGLFTRESSFKYIDIKDMLKNRYLSPGTRFKRGKHEYEVSEMMKLIRLGEI